MSQVKELYLLTEAMVTLVTQPLPKDEDDRDQLIAEIEEKLEQRDRLIPLIDGGALSEPEKRLGLEIVKLNKRLITCLEYFRAEIRANITELKTKKETGRKYENPYDGPTSGGIYFDKRGV